MFIESQLNITVLGKKKSTNIQTHTICYTSIGCRTLVRTRLL